MIRITLLWLVVSGLAVYAWKDWYKSLCGLILLVAVVEHPDMPKTIFGIQGLNPWNLLLLVIILAWMTQRSREGLVWDMPRSISILLLAQLGLVLVGFFRMMADRSGLEEATTGYLVSQLLINTVKWVIPGLLLFDGCRSRSRFALGLASLLALYFLLGVQVIRWMPASVAFSGQSLTARSAKILVNEVGYHRVNLSMMLAGASWAIFATRPLAKRRIHVMLIVAASLAVVYAQALTAGRMGYVTWIVVGLALSLARWQKYLFLAPLVAFAIASAVPGVVERMSQGLDDSDPDPYVITAGRNIAWPYVIEKIGESPVVGYGRLAMYTTGTEAFLREELGESFPHPHNAYLELLLDNGWMGLLLVLPFYLVVLAQSILLFRDSRSPVFVAIGGVTSSLVLALLVASVGSQTFYPREGSVGMWCAIGLLLRVALERSRALAMARHHAAEPWGADRTRPASHDLPSRLLPAGLAEERRKAGKRVSPFVTIDGILWRRAP